MEQEIEDWNEHKTHPRQNGGLQPVQEMNMHESIIYEWIHLVRTVWLWTITCLEDIGQRMLGIEIIPRPGNY